MTWARFETSDINDPSLFGEPGLGGAGMPLLLVLGYSSGVQVMTIMIKCFDLQGGKIFSFLQKWPKYQLWSSLRRDKKKKFLTFSEKRGEGSALS